MDFQGFKNELFEGARKLISGRKYSNLRVREIKSAQQLLKRAGRVLGN